MEGKCSAVNRVAREMHTLMVNGQVLTAARLPNALIRCRKVTITCSSMRALGILPVLFFCGVTFILRRNNPLRDALTVAGLITALWVVAGCEVLSLFEAVAFWPLLIWWSAPVVVLAWKCRAGRPTKPVASRDWLLLATIGATALVLLLIFIQAAFTPPNNWDALSYHLPRQVYWMQQRHVGLFPTEDARMAIMPPFAEYAGLHLMILSGGDKWLNLIQWFALALTASTASCIARELGCNARLQALAALLVVIVPIAALEASNPKNDVVTAFFLCACAWAGLRAYHSKQFSAPLIGAMFGLLILSKSTGMIFGLPVAVWIGVAHMRAAGFKRAIIWGSAVTAIVLAINSGPFVRLTRAFGSPLGPPMGKGAPPVANKSHSPRALASNLVRNTVMHLATGSSGIDRHLTEAVAGLHRLVGSDMNDPNTTFARTAPFAVTPNISDEDRAKAPVHVVLGVTMTVLAMVALFRRQDTCKNMFALMPMLGLIVFSYVLAWQEWHSRLHIPLLCLTAAIAPYMLRRASAPFAVAGFALALFAVTTNEAKPLFHLKQARDRFRGADVLSGVGEAKRAVREHGPRVLGIYSARRCEYFLLSAILKNEGSTPRFLKVNNSYPQIPSPYPAPDLVISWYRQPPQSNVWFYSKYVLASQQGAVAVFIPRK